MKQTDACVSVWESTDRPAVATFDIDNGRTFVACGLPVSAELTDVVLRGLLRGFIDYAARGNVPVFQVGMVAHALGYEVALRIVPRAPIVTVSDE